MTLKHICQSQLHCFHWPVLRRLGQFFWAKIRILIMKVILYDFILLKDTP